MEKNGYGELLKKAREAKGLKFAEVYKVLKVDEQKMRIEVCRPDQGKTQTYILISMETKVYQNDAEIKWTQIQPNSVIKVEGGMTWDLKVKAKKIWFE